MENEYNDPQLFALLEARDFEDLRETEKDLVLSKLSKAEYQAYRKTIVEGQLALQNQVLVPTPMVKRQLKNAFQNQYPKKNFTQLVFSYNVSLWKVILGIIGLICFWWWQESKVIENAPRQKIETIYVYQTDTIYQPVYLPTPVKEVVKKVKKKVEHNQNQVSDALKIPTEIPKTQTSEEKPKDLDVFAVDRPLQNNFDLALENIEQPNVVNGQRAIEDTALIQLVGKVQ